MLLVPAGAVTLTGRVSDGLGGGIPGITVQATASVGGVQTNAATDATGTYTMQIAPGNYSLAVGSANANPAVAASRNFNFVSTSPNPVSIPASTTIDFPLPFKRVAVRVQDPAGNGIANIKVTGSSGQQNGLISASLTGRGSASYPDANITTTNATGDTILWLYPTLSSNYSLTATPPTGSPYTTTSINNVAISGDTSLTITMVTPITLTGRVSDGLGGGIPGITVQATASVGGVQTNAATDATGTYTMQIAPGNYSLAVGSANANPAVAASRNFNFVSTSPNPVSIPASTTIDFPLPFKRVAVRVQDPAGNGIANIKVTGSSGQQNGLVSASLTGRGSASYPDANITTTNATGDTILWLYPTLSSNYSLTATPPTGSPYTTTSVNNVAISGDTALVIALQFVHSQPVTTASFSPQAVNSIYTTSPVTVTLSATAASGFTIASTKYAIDGGATQTYTAPFTISGDGTHTLTYFSTDNLGVFESTKTATLQIQTATPTPTFTPTPTNTPTLTPTNTSAPTDTPTPTSTATITPTPSNPVPAISSLLPVATQSGGAVFSLVVAGSGFVPSSTVTWNGADRPTTYNSPTQLTALIAAADIASPGSAIVSVFNPAPGGGTSNQATFTITQGNRPPSAFANGPYTVATGDSVQLSGSGSDPDGDAITFAWDLDNNGSFETSGQSPIFSAVGLPIGTTRTIILQVCDSHGLCGNSAPTTITVISDLRIITQSPLQNGTVGQPYSVTLQASGGQTPYQWSVPSGSLPPGLSLNATTGEISGTPTNGGTYAFTIQVADSSQITTTKSFALAPPPVSGTAGQAYPPTPLQPSAPAPSNGSPAPPCTNYTLAPGSDPLPVGMSLDPVTGLLSGTPAGGGSYHIVVQCTYNTTQTATADFTITINEPTPTPTATPVPTDTPTPTATATDTPTPTSTATVVPTDTPTPTATATDTATPTATPTDTPVPTDTPTPTATATNTPVPTDTPTPTSTATDTPTPTSTSVPTDTPTPTFTPTTTLAPTDTPTPTFTPTVTVVPTNTPTLAPSLTPTSTATTAPLSTPTPVLTSLLISPPTATVAVGGTVQIAANGTYSDGSTRDVASSVTWTSDATGVASINTNGVLTGVSIGVANISASLGGVTSNLSHVQVISALTITTSSTLSAGTVGTSYTATIQATGGNTPYQWTLEPGSTLPPGLTMTQVNNTAVISGTPTSAGNYSFTLRVTDSSAVTTTRRFVIPAPPPPPCTVGVDCGGGVSTPVPDCTNFALAPGSGPLPPGVTLDPSTGKLLGTPTSGGTFQVTVQCTYNTNQTATASFTLTINNPTPHLTALVPSSAPQGGSAFFLTVQGTGFVQDSKVYWNGSPRTTAPVGTGLLPTELQAQILVTDLTSAIPVTVTVSNPGPGGGSSNGLPFTITPNTPTTAEAGGPYTGLEGSAVSLSGSGTGPTGSSLTYLWTYTKGSNVDAGATCSFASATSPATTITCTDDGTYELKLTVTDSHQATASDTATLTVTNVKPAVTITGPQSGSLYVVGTPVNLTGAFTDPGANDTHTATWSLDSTPVTGAVTENAGNGTVAASYTFTSAGVYLVKLTVTDDDGGVGEATTIGDIYMLIVVYDPNGGFVTGGGWFNSPSGACQLSTACGGATGKANFGFVSKYQQGAQTPSGQTEFQFKAGDLNFHSTAYEWLVVAGAKAQYKGTGTINGSGNYGFMLTATDGQVSGGGGVDKLRVKIWDKNNGDAIVYDNQMGGSDTADPSTSLGGGSIVVHKD